MTKVTYKPGRHDPTEVEWNGVLFEANLPVELNDEEHFVVVDLPIDLESPDGIIRTRTQRKKIPMVELARNNPSFRVEGAPIPKAAVIKDPKTAEEYKHYATRFINEADDHELLAMKWESDKEQKLRKRCRAENIGEDLSALFTQRIAFLKKAAGHEERRKRQREEELEDVS